MKEKIEVGKRTYRRNGVVKEALVIQWKRKIEVRDSKTEPDLSPFVKGAVVYRHTIVVACEGSEAKFTVWGSVYEYKMGKEIYNADDLLSVFEILLKEAIDAIEFRDIDELAKEYGLTKPSEALRAWRGINNTYRKLKRVLGIANEEFYELHNAIVDYINERDGEIPVIA